MPVQRRRLRARQTARVTAVQPQGHHVGADMGGLARPEIGKAGQQRRAHQVVIAQDGGARGQVCGDVAQLAPIEQLRVRLIAAEVIGQCVDLARGLLHQKHVRPFVTNQANHVAQPGARQPQQIPADDLDHAASVRKGGRKARLVAVMLHCTLP